MCGFLFSSSKTSKDIVLLESGFNKLIHRGPDATQKLYLKDGTFIGFHRLAIMGLSKRGEQPFHKAHEYMVCNGEIYNYDEMTKELSDYQFSTGSDCEVILPYFQRFGGEALVKALDGEFAFIIYDEKTSDLFAARDPMGIRPLFYGKLKKDKALIFSSEVKAITDLCDEVYPFPPGHYYSKGKFIKFHDYEKKNHSTTISTY